MFSPATLKAIRQTHHYTGVFLAPAVLFFAITGCLQTFSLHETTRGSSYKPPALLVHLSQLHKKATIVVPQRKPAPAAPAASPEKTPPAKAPETAPQPPAHNLLPMKIFFAIVALGLVLSTLSGLVMAFKYTRRTMLVTAILIAGVVVPLLLLLV
jgi:hypothetical protein